MYPTFLIAGPPKSATTSLHFYLGQHPQVFMSRVKETEFFTRDYHKGKAFYQHYFANADKAVSIGEATPSYSFLPFAADRIQETIPHVKIIFCFRNPMERAFSHWLTLWSEGIEKESFSKAITINKEQLKYVNFQGEPGSVQWNKTARHEKKEKNWIRPYLHPGMCVQSLRIYFERFERKNIWIIFLEDLKDNFDNTMKDIFVFLGVDGNFIIPQKDVQNFSYNKRFTATL